jgi:hypothetical protein
MSARTMPATLDAAFALVKAREVEAWLASADLAREDVRALVDELHRLVSRRTETPQMVAALAFLEGLTVDAEDPRPRTDTAHRNRIANTMIARGATTYASRLAVKHATRARAIWSRKGRRALDSETKGKWVVLSEVCLTMKVRVTASSLKSTWAIWKRSRKVVE